MADNIICAVCGGKEFIKEAGFYYCSECQTQTQELREQEFDLEQTFAATRTTRTTISHSERATSSSKQATQLASWEVFNYVLCGLTGELVELGASNELRDVTRLLWFEYLRKLGIVSRQEGNKPRLGLAGRNRDAQVVYNKRKQRRARSCTTSSVTDVNIRQLRREKARRKRALVKAEYERDKDGASTRSLADVTLSGVSSGSETSDAEEKKPRYNRAAAKALKKSSKRGYRLHYMPYWKSVWALKRVKLYSLLCIAAQLTNTDTKTWLPGDILRACHDGHISFLDYQHMLPVDAPEGTDLPVIRGRKRLPTHHILRRNMKELVEMLHINLKQFTPNILVLVERYCKELQLPDEIKNAVCNLIKETSPEFQNKQNMFVPNYEGRAMAFILYTLKLLFGLDGVTEFKLSDFAQQINEKFNENMFVFSQWTSCMEYRKIILRNMHFPTSFLLGHNDASKLHLFVQFLKQQKNEDDHDNYNNLTKEVIDKILKDLESYECGGNNVFNSVNFSHSHTPYYDYLKIILDKCENLLINGHPIQKNILRDFSDTKLEYIFDYHVYLKKLYNERYIILRKGAHKNNKYTDLELKLSENYQQWEEVFEENKLDYLLVDKLENYLLHKKLKIDTVKTLETKNIDINSVLENKNNKDKVGRDKSGRFCPKNSPKARTDENYHDQRKRGKYFLSSWVANSKLSENTPNTLYTARHSCTLDKMAQKLISRKSLRNQNDSFKHTHYLPYQEHWILCTSFENKENYEPIKQKKWTQMKEMLPPTFQTLLGELAQICGQTQRYLYEEFMLVEMYVSYVHLGLSASSKEVAKIVPNLSCHW